MNNEEKIISEQSELCSDMVAEMKRFELLRRGTPDLPHFEQKAVSTAQPLSVPKFYNMSVHSARFCKSNDFLREICEIDARNDLKPLCVLGQRKHKENKNESRKTKRSL